MSESGGLWTVRRLLALAGGVTAIALFYALRGVLVPLFLAFLVAYALDPIVDRLERWRVPRSAGAPLVMVALIAALITGIFLGVPFAVKEFRDASQRLPELLDGLHVRAEALLWEQFHYRLPATWSELLAKYGGTLREQLPEATKVGSAFFGTVNAIFVLLGTLIIPVFALYLLGDFDRIMRRSALLVPRRWAPGVTRLAQEIHVTLGRYVRGQLITNLILATLYAVGLQVVGVRLAIPIGILTGMLSFIPYVGLLTGTSLAALMALLDWHGPGQIIGVLVVMGTVGLCDSMVITPRIVGGSVGLRPLEVLLTMAGAATLFGFIGILLAVPIGAVLKIVLHHGVEAYLGSRFYTEPGVPEAQVELTSIPPLTMRAMAALETPRPPAPSTPEPAPETRPSEPT